MLVWHSAQDPGWSLEDRCVQVKHKQEETTWTLNIMKHQNLSTIKLVKCLCQGECEMVSLWQLKELLWETELFEQDAISKYVLSAHGHVLPSAAYLGQSRAKLVLTSHRNVPLLPG